MPKPNRHELLALALGVLPQPPATVDVLSEDGGSFPFEITAVEGELLHGFAPRSHVRQELHMLARVEDAERGRYEVEFEIAEAFYQSDALALVHAAVSGVRHRKMRRSSPRVATTEKGRAEVLFCRSLARGQVLDVRMSDISTTGLAFTAREQLHEGDLLQLSISLGGKPLSCGVRVVRSDPAPYGRHRAGCETTDMDEAARQLIADMAMHAPVGDGVERRGEAAARVRTIARDEQSALLRRLKSV